MYEAFYKLGSDPFRLLPDPEICFPHRSCAKAWAYLRYALKRGEGIVVVTGPPGSGKTTLAERLLKELNPSKTVSVRLIANDLNPTDLLRKLAYSFGLPAEGMDRAMLAHRIERYLIELEHSQRQALVLIDEAQTLSHQSLEAMRLLTDIQSRSRPVLQLFLLGQEELEGVMSAPGMTQFQQRVIASSRLARMDLAETKAYLEYRLGFADWRGDPSINGPAVMAIYRFSRGLPRHVNKICSRLLLHGCTEEKHALKQRDVLAVVQDLRHELLAPLEDEPEVSEDVAETAFDSVYELALVPPSLPVAAAKPASDNAMDTLFLAEDTASASDGGTDRSAQSGGARLRGGGREGAGGRYFDRVDSRRPFRFRRRVYDLFRIPGLLVGGIRDSARRWAPEIGGFLTGLGRKSKDIVTRARGLIRDRFAESVPWLEALRERVGARPTMVVSGLAGLLVIGLALMVWGQGADLEQTLADGGRTDHGKDFLLYQSVDGRSEGPALLEEPKRYMDVAELPVGKGNYVSSVLGSEQTLRQGMVEADVSDYRSIMQGDPDHLLLGRVTGESADYLIGRVTQAASTLDVWSLANRVPGMSEEGLGDANGIAVAVQPDREGSARPAAASGSKTGVSGGERHAENENNRLIALDESGASLDFIGFLPAPAAGVASAEVPEATVPVTDRETPVDPSVSEASEVRSAPVNPIVDSGASPGLPSEELVELAVPAAESADLDMVLLQVTEAPSPDQSAVESMTEERAEVERLLALAAEAIRKDRLLVPQDRAAYGYLKKVLVIDAENAAARSGLDRIALRYRDLARWSLDEQDFDNAGRFIERGLKVDPDNARILAVRNELNDAIAEAEAAELAAAELARMAMEPPKPAPPVQKKRQESNFSSLMRFVDGLPFGADN